MTEIDILGYALLTNKTVLRLLAHPAEASQALL